MFCYPSSQLSHDGRRNLTDLQETAQWLGGVSVAKSILVGLLGNLEQFVILFVWGGSQENLLEFDHLIG